VSQSDCLFFRSEKPVDSARHSNCIDRSFCVPFVHRVRFTTDLFGTEQKALADVLIPSAAERPRVQFCADANVLARQSGLERKVADFCQRYSDRIVRVGGIEPVRGGEQVKNEMRGIERLLKVFHEAALDRHSYVVVIGGGAVLDALGFAAAIAHRGLRLVRLPTSTLSQGDSGVGVKNGVNFFREKNWLGSFSVPWAVINDTRLLESLSDRDFVSGFSESIKVSMLKDAALFEDLCRSAPRIRRRDLTVAIPLVRRSALLHLDHITEGGDPFEMRDARPLDFGHWSAHKLESLSSSRLRHGEAVAIGVAIDAVYSSLECGLSTQEVDRVLRCLSDLGLALDCRELDDTEALFQGLEEFRRHLGGRLNLTMLRGLGNPVEIHEVNHSLMRQSIATVRKFAREEAIRTPARD
jgi:3-dehydroquinate synthase